MSRLTLYSPPSPPRHTFNICCVATHETKGPRRAQGIIFNNGQCWLFAISAVNLRHGPGNTRTVHGVAWIEALSGLLCICDNLLQILEDQAPALPQNGASLDIHVAGVTQVVWSEQDGALSYGYPTARIIAWRPPGHHQEHSKYVLFWYDHDTIAVQENEIRRIVQADKPGKGPDAAEDNKNRAQPRHADEEGPTSRLHYHIGNPEGL